jgi:hypothetical protein
VTQRKRLRIATDTVVAATAAVAALADPSVGAAAAVLAPGVAVGLAAVADKVERRRRQRQGAVLWAAAKQAGIVLDELVSRLEADPEREELVERTLSAAQSAAQPEKLVAYAVSLANGSVAEDVADVEWETTFVRVLDDLDWAHVSVLSCFTRTATELGLQMPGSDPDPAMHTLSEVQVEIVTEVANLPSVLAVLQRHGLVAFRARSGGMTFSGGSGGNWQITSFGVAFMDRMTAVGDALRQSAS